MELRGKIAPMANNLIAWLRRPLRFERSWWMPLGTGGVLGALVVFIIVFLEPSGTDRYQAPWRTLRLSGYSLCFLVPFALVHGLDRWRFRRRRRWRVGDELYSKTLVVVGVIGCSYLYKATVINAEPLNWTAFGDWLLYICLPYVALLMVPGVLVRRGLLRRLDRARRSAGSIEIRGRNRGERLRILAGGFVFAEAQQNYVDLHYVDGERARQHMIRVTLTELQQQIPDAVRVHRSYLVNPARVQAVEGNVRKRRVRLAGTDRPVPVSAGFDPAQLPAAQSRGELP